MMKSDCLLIPYYPVTLAAESKNNCCLTVFGLYAKCKLILPLTFSILFDGGGTEVDACIKVLKAILVSATTTIPKHNTCAMQFAKLPALVTLSTGSFLCI